MPKRNPEVTPNGKIKNAIRLLWSHCREKNAALKRDKYSCVDCGKKKSIAKGKEQKVEVHHLKPIDWSIIEDIKSKVLHTKEEYQTLCPNCHNIHHPERVKNNEA